MNPEILTKEVQQFISDNLATDIHRILLNKSPFANVSAKELVEQIESKLKSREKLPLWFGTDDIVYPNKLNLSQSSSEKTALYKASLIYGNSIIDLTGGFGVDCFAFSSKAKRVVHVEQNDNLSQIAKHNFEKLGISNVECITGDGIDFLKYSTAPFDWIYVDPSRRNRENKKVYYLTDCEPDITKHIDLLFSKARNILVKTGPLLDIRVGLGQMRNVREIHIVAVKNDVKEVLWILQKDFMKEPLIKTLNFNKIETQEFQFTLSEEQTANATYSSPKQYLYEPNAAILKSGAFQYVSNFYKLDKLHPNSHLYTSNELISFPGRTFQIVDVLEYSKKVFKKLKLTQANITTRNFPESVLTIKNKLGLKDGGDAYLFCTTDMNQKLLILYCSKLFVDQDL